MFKSSKKNQKKLDESTQPQDAKDDAKNPNTKMDRIKAWLSKSKILLFSVAGLVLLLVLVWFTPLRYPVLGVFFKGTVEIVVADSNTLQPLEGAQVEIAGKSATTNKEGKATLSDVTLGSQTLRVTKTAYKDFSRKDTIFIGTNKLAPVELEGSGIPISFKIVDSVSGLPLKDVAVKLNDVAATTSDEGLATLSVLPTGGIKGLATFSKDGFNQGSLEIDIAQVLEPYEIKLTPAGKTYFLSNRSGNIDLYQSNLDASEETVLLAGTGKEDGATRIEVSENGKWIVLLSSREGLRSATKQLYPVLYVIDASSKALTKLVSEPNISFVGWSSNSIIYTTGQGPIKINSYNLETKKKTELATLPYYNSILFSSDQIFYALGDKNQPDYGFYSIRADGTTRKKILEKPAASYLTGKDEITLNDYDDYEWYTYSPKSARLEKLPGQPASLETKELHFSPDGTKATTVFYRDGRSELYLTDADGENEKKLTSVNGAKTPIRWINNNYVVFRVSNSDQKADYIINVNGGTAVKISDVYESQPYN